MHCKASRKYLLPPRRQIINIRFCSRYCQQLTVIVLTVRTHYMYPIPYKSLLFSTEQLPSLMLEFNDFIVLTTDQASADNAQTVGLMAEKFAKKGWHFAQKQDSKSTSFNKPPGTRAYSTSAPQTSSPSITLITGGIADFPPRLQALQKEITDFLKEELYPIEEELMEHQRSSERWIPHQKMERLKVSPLILY